MWYFTLFHDYFILKPSKSIALLHLCKTACLFVRQSLHLSITRESCKMVFPTFFCTNWYQEYETMPISTIFCNFLLIFGKKKWGYGQNFSEDFVKPIQSCISNVKQISKRLFTNFWLFKKNAFFTKKKKIRKLITRPNMGWKGWDFCWG